MSASHLLPDTKRWRSKMPRVVSAVGYLKEHQRSVPVAYAVEEDR